MTNLLDATTLPPSEAARFIANVLEASTEYSIIGLEMDGTILLWNSGARRLYGWEPKDVIGKASWDLLHLPEDVAAGKPADMAKVALEEGKWEGTVLRLRRDGSQFTARVVLTPRRDENGEPLGFLLMSKDISADIRLTEELEATQFYTRSLKVVAL
jgi:PAS domain S-box-containing protein